MGRVNQNSVVSAATRWEITNSDRWVGNMVDALANGVGKNELALQRLLGNVPNIRG